MSTLRRTCNDLPIYKLSLFGLCCFLTLGIAFYSHNVEDAGAASPAGERTLVLYDAASGTLPGVPLMTFTDFPPGAALPVYSHGVTVLDTTTAGRDTYAGWTSSGATTPGFPILDRAAGFQVDFSLQVEEESHRNNNRSGFSLIVLSKDTRGVELAFWENEIWAQSDSNTGGLFKHAEGIIFPTTTGLIEYRLAITGDTYTLTANTQSILSGPVRDYSDFEGLPNPYQTANFLFLGDDTSSAQARVRLGFVSITGTQPVMSTGTIESTSPSSGTPLPAALATARLSVTPVPSVVPTGKALELCSSGGLFLALMITCTMMLRGVRARSKDGSETTPD